MGSFFIKLEKPHWGSISEDFGLQQDFSKKIVSVNFMIHVVVRDGLQISDLILSEFKQIN